jgi:hypothetical protein
MGDRSFSERWSHIRWSSFRVAGQGDDPDTGAWNQYPDDIAEHDCYWAALLEDKVGRIPVSIPFGPRFEAEFAGWRLVLQLNAKDNADDTAPLFLNLAHDAVGYAFSPRMDAAAVPVRSDQETGWTTNSIVAAVLVQARQQPGRVAILLEDQAISYSRLCVDIERFARGMRMRAVLGGKQLPVPLGDDLDGAVGHLHRGLIIDRVRWHG